jgi:hypothetical protein
MPKYIATLDFTGIQGIYYPCKRGNVYEFKESETIDLLLKVGYLKKYDVAVTEPTLVKELKHEYETKELKVESKTKRKRKDA